jgi:hypothetical protein
VYSVQTQLQMQDSENTSSHWLEALQLHSVYKLEFACIRSLAGMINLFIKQKYLYVFLIYQVIQISTTFEIS